MKRVWVALAFLAAVGMLSLSTTALAKKGKLGGLYQAAENNHFAPVPKTGSTYDDPGAIGDDGELQKGIPWPQPRFTDNGDGTVTDNLTSLVWTKNANIWGTDDWSGACEQCNQLADGEGGLTDGSVAGNWRLPNARELQSLISYGFDDPALPNTSGTGKWTEGNPFTNVQSSNYWSSTVGAGTTSNAWYVFFFDGVVRYGAKGNGFYVWCVRGGN